MAANDELHQMEEVHWRIVSALQMLRTEPSYFKNYVLSKATLGGTVNEFRERMNQCAKRCAYKHTGWKVLKDMLV